MLFYLPGWLDLNELFIVATESKLIKPLKKEHLFYILSQFFVVPSINKSLLSPDGYLTLNAQLLQKYVRNYNHYLKFLIREGVIVYPNNSGYKVGELSKSYRLYLPEGFDATPITIKVTDSVLLKKYSRFLNRKKQLKSMNYLTKWLYEGLEINIKEAVATDERELIQKLESGDWDTITKWDERSKMLVMSRKDPRYRSISNRAAIQRIFRGDLYHSIDDKGYRLHTNLTNLAKVMRPFVTYNGHNLGAIDIKNSQPFLSLILFNSEFWTGARTVYSDFWRSSNIVIEKKSSIIMLAETFQFTIDQDVNKFRDLVVNGLLYETFAEQLTVSLGKPFSRSQAKTEMLKVFFSDNRYFIQDGAESKPIFRQMFPGIYNIYSLIKKGNKPLLACLLQQIESYLVLQIICKRIAKEYPLLPIFTIHDSVVTLEEYLPVVKKIMHEELLNFIGYPPSLSEEVWRTEADLINDGKLSQRTAIAIN